MPDIDKIRQDLADTAKYHGMSYAAIVGVASEIEAVEDRQERAALRREFRELHALTSQVWARVAKRFMAYERANAQWIRAAAYCCQLPESECHELFDTHNGHLDEPGALGLILRDVNDALDARRNGHGHKRIKTTPLAERIGHHIFNNELATAFALICNEPEIKADLARRAYEMKEDLVIEK